jgi:hypothetical protein
MKAMNPNVFPKGGRYFKESDGVTIVGDTWEGIIARVVAYRKRAGLPVGNPKEEVITQACARDPVLCTEERPEYKAQVAIVSLKTKILKWLVFVQGEKDRNALTFVDPVHARNRAEVCAQCPKNQAIPDGCASCKAALTESRRKILGNRPIDARVNECIVMEEDIPVTSNIDMQTVDRPGLPDYCWRRRSL